MEKKTRFTSMAQVILKAVSLGMGVAVAALSALGTLDSNVGIGMLGMGLVCLAAATLGKHESR